MRLEIIIPHNTRQDRKAKLTSLAEQLSAHPELIDEISLNAESDDEAIQKLFTPELVAEVEAAHADMRAGNRVTMQELDEQLAATRARWLAANQSWPFLFRGRPRNN